MMAHTTRTDRHQRLLAALLTATAITSFALVPEAQAQAVAAQATVAPTLAEAAGPSADAAPEAGAADDAGGGDVVVTARRREERAQDVPIALSVVGAEQLGVRGDFRLDQVQQLVPSLQVFSFNPRNTNINIRGLGSNVALTNDGLENGVGVYIDNVYYGRVGQSQFDLVDLDRVEVLRGPQGTLFGKNTTAGAINISSKLPKFDWGFDGQADVGNYDFRQLRGSLTGPLVEDLAAFRLSGAYTERNGFLYDTTTKRDVHDYANYTVRGQLLLTPAAGLTARIIGDWGQQDQNCCINVLVNSLSAYDNGQPIANNFLARAARVGYTPTFDPFARRTDANSPFQANMNTWGVSGQLDYDLGGAALTSITAYRNWNWFPLNDGDYTAMDINVKGHLQNHQKQFSQELRLASTGTHTIDWLVGAYYFWQVVRGDGQFQFGSDAALALFPADDQNVALIASNGFQTKQFSDPHTKSAAAFGQGTWHIIPTLDLTLGIRYTHEDKYGGYSSTGVFGLPTTGLTDAQIARVNAIRNILSPAQSFYVDTSDDSVSGLATLGWKPVPDVLIYATYSRGSKSQGINLTTLPAGVDPVIDPEKVNNYEVGVKSQFLDRSVTVNLAAYRTDVDQYQTTIVQQTVNQLTFINYLANIPSVRSQGVEGDVAWRAADWLSLTGAFSYTDAKYIEYPNGPTPVESLNPTPATPTAPANPAGTPVSDFAGKPLAGVPKWSASLGGDVSQPINDRGAEVYLHGDWSYRSSYYTVSSDSRYGRVPGYDVVNARLGVRLGQDGRYDLSVFARNLLDHDYYQTLGVQAYGLIVATLGDPRTFGGTLKVRF